MKNALLALAVAATLPAAALAAVKTYQVTGPVLEIGADSITVQKGSEKWEIAKDAAAKVTGDLKVGAKVTVEYTMTAKTVEVKADKAAKADKPAASKAPKADKAAKK